MDEQRIKKPKVYFKKDVTVESVVELYDAVGRKFDGKTFSLVDSAVDHFVVADKFVGFIGSTRYAGDRFDETLVEVGFYGHLQGECLISKNLCYFDSFVVLSRFKRSEGEFGGAIDALGLRMASERGRRWIRSAGFTKDEDVMFSHVENDFRYCESKAEACKGVLNQFGRANFVYINIVCAGSDPVGIVAGVDPVAVDKASLDITIKIEKDFKYLTDCDDTEEIQHTLNYAEKIGIGELDYNLIEI